MNLLLTSIGKRIQLIEHLKTKFRVIGADAGMDNAAKHFVDAFYQIPRCTDERYIPSLLEICRKEEIKVLIPLYEDEFPILAKHRGDFDDIGTILLLSDSEVIDICKDKNKMAAFFASYEIPAPKTWSGRSVMESFEQGAEGLFFPTKTEKYVIKPVNGMGSEGVYIASNEKELRFFSEYVSDCVVQECAKGEEITIDILCDLEGEPIHIVPRKRLEVRSGEVVKSQTIYAPEIVQSCISIIEDMKMFGKFLGPINIQCFQNSTGKLEFIEINPRFGGGMPLSFEAGADFADAIYHMANKEQVTPKIGAYREMKMYRFDRAIYEEIS